MAATPERLRRLANRNDPALDYELREFASVARGLARQIDSDFFKDLDRLGNFDVADVNAVALILARGMASELVSELDQVHEYDRAREYGRATGLAQTLVGTIDHAGDRHIPRPALRQRNQFVDTAKALAQTLDELSGEDADNEILNLYSMVGSIIYVLVLAPYSDTPSAAVEGLSDLVDLAVNNSPAKESVAAFNGRLEALIRDAELALDQGRFDSDDRRFRQVERDLGYLRDEAYETDPDDFLGEALGAMVARLGRNIASVTEIPDDVAPIINAVLEVMSRDQPDQVPDVLDAVLLRSSLDDRDWLASQEQFEAFAVQIEHEGPERWFANVLGWIDSEHFGTDVGVVRNAGAVGVLVGSGIGLVVSAFLNNMVATSAASATVGGIIGVALGWVAVRYRNRLQTDADRNGEAWRTEVR